jgi:hypothetical protein
MARFGTSLRRRKPHFKNPPGDGVVTALGTFAGEPVPGSRPATRAVR